jgi:hypothetical protein
MFSESMVNASYASIRDPADMVSHFLVSLQSTAMSNGLEYQDEGDHSYHNSERNEHEISDYTPHQLGFLVWLGRLRGRAKHPRPVFRPSPPPELTGAGASCRDSRERARMPR